MRSATLAKLTLTAAVGLGALVGQSTLASAGVTPKGGTIQVAPTPNIDPGGKVKVGPAVTTTSTIKPLPGKVVNPDPQPQPDPPFDPDLPLSNGDDDDDCTGPACDIAPKPQGEPHHCNELLANCDELGSDPGCTWTHGCPTPCEEDPDLPQCNLTSDGGTTDGGGTGGTDGHGTDGSGTTGGTDGSGTTGGTGGSGTTGGGDHGSRLPHTGLEVSALAGLGLGLTGLGAAVKRLSRRSRTTAS